MIKKEIAAFFDIDGTIHRDSLLIEHFKMLVKYEFIDMSSWTGQVKEKFNKWSTRKGNYDDYLLELVSTYKDALTNLREDEMNFIANRVIQLKGDKVYKYTRQKIEEHKRKGHKLIIISGSPDFLVGKMAQKYGIEDYVGAEYISENGIYTGDVVPMWDAKSKQKALNKFCKKYNLDLSQSYAYGDTTGDLTMFKNVGKPIAINPSMELMKKIKKSKELSEKIKIVVERKDVVYKFNPNVEIM